MTVDGMERVDFMIMIQMRSANERYLGGLQTN